ncbi:hypothetical protein HY385_02140 [Candidatus Daviesbacteria bacterium]|nr:hypothetical protein [Candidatus Daviesbacteria bacterium]
MSPEQVKILTDKLADGLSARVIGLLNDRVSLKDLFEGEGPVDIFPEELQIKWAIAQQEMSPIQRQELNRVLRALKGSYKTVADVRKSIEQKTLRAHRLGIGSMRFTSILFQTEVARERRISRPDNIIRFPDKKAS